MMKLLLLPEVLNDALKGQNQEAVGLVDKCKTDFDIQAWTLSSTVQTLVAQDLSPDRICTVLEGIPQIPVNARLNREALQSPHGFAMGVHLAAARIFKIPTLVAAEAGSDLDGISVVSYGQALNPQRKTSADKVDFLNLNLALHPIFDRVDGWFMEIIQNGAFAGGDHVAAFEREFAEYCGVQHSIGVGNGTDALRFSLLAIGVKPGDEVITVPNTFIATTEAISQVGAHPVFVDVLPGTYNINPALIESRITERTKVILPVHLYGQIGDMDAVMAIAGKYELKVLEDACQSHGALYKGRRAGSLGHAAAFSMYPGKNLGAFGEAGCITTDDPGIADIAACLRDHGQSEKYHHRMEGYNGRMDNLQAAALRGKLPWLDQWTEKRRQVAMLYSAKLADVPQVRLPDVADYSAHVFHLFVILVPSPNELSEYLRQREIFTGFHYPVPLHQQEAYRNCEELQGCYPVSEDCAKALMSLPMFPELTEAQIDLVCDGIKEFYSHR